MTGFLAAIRTIILRGQIHLNRALRLMPTFFPISFSPLPPPPAPCRKPFCPITIAVHTCRFAVAPQTPIRSGLDDILVGINNLGRRGSPYYRTIYLWGILMRLVASHNCEYCFSFPFRLNTILRMLRAFHLDSYSKAVASPGVSLDVAGYQDRHSKQRKKEKSASEERRRRFCG